MTGIKALTIAAVSGTAALAQVDPVATGQAIGRLGPTAILGVVAVSCVVGLVRVYRDKEKHEVEMRKAHDEHTERLYGLIEANTEASQEQATAYQRHADNAAQVAGILVEVKDAIRGCNK